MEVVFPAEDSDTSWFIFLEFCHFYLLILVGSLWVTKRRRWNVPARVFFSLLKHLQIFISKICIIYSKKRGDFPVCFWSRWFHVWLLPPTVNTTSLGNNPLESVHTEASRFCSSSGKFGVKTWSQIVEIQINIFYFSVLVFSCLFFRGCRNQGV